MLNWISEASSSEIHRGVRFDRTSDTCEWLLQHGKFKDWESSNSLLWLQGAGEYCVGVMLLTALAGTGKPFLTSKVINHVQSSYENSLEDGGFAYFYCNRNDPKRRNALTVLRGYVRQLSTTVKAPQGAREGLRDVYRKRKLNGPGLDWDECMQQLLEAVNLYPQTTLVLDALDECPESVRVRLVKAMVSLLSKSKTLKVFISSRPARDIRDQLLGTQRIEIQAVNNLEDIKKYVDEQIVQHGNWGNMCLQLQTDIVETLLKRSEGM